MQPYSSQEESDHPAGYELSFPHIKLAAPEDELLSKSILDSLSPTPSSSTASTPYRLPKLSGAGSVSSTTSSDRSDNPPKDVHAQDEKSPRQMYTKGRKNLASTKAPAKSVRAIQRIPNPPYTIAQLRRAQNIQVPSFKKAQFAPLISSPVHPVEMPRLVGGVRQGEHSHVEFDPELPRASTRFTHASRSSYGARSAAVSMTIPMATGSVYSRQPDQKAEWRLSPYRHNNYDNQAVSPQIGPYSRGFVIHCSTPKTWLHMKLRRTKTTLM